MRAANARRAGEPSSAHDDAAQPQHQTNECGLGSGGMKYVDEFRDRAKAQILLREIEALAAAIETTATRPIQIMEVCGGHTHSIFRYGIEGMLPKSIELVHGPGCPVCVLPMGRVDDCVAIAERPEVIFTTFGDAMRVPGSRKSLLQAKADGADVRMVYSPLDALALGAAQPGPRGGLLRPRLRDHDALDRADGAAGANAKGSRISRCSATTSPSSRRSRRSSTVPICISTAFSVRATSPW